jgi:hypothetical protein
VELDRHGLEVLDRDRCLELLRQHGFGRVAITAGALPCVLPVNYRVIDDQVMFRTARGSKLDAATRNAVVAFEVDDMDPLSHTGWSVVVTGVARVLDEEGRDALDLPLARWAPDRDGHVVAISTEVTTGRRLLAGGQVSGEGLTQPTAGRPVGPAEDRRPDS